MIVGKFCSVATFELFDKEGEVFVYESGPPLRILPVISNTAHKIDFGISQAARVAVPLFYVVSHGFSPVRKNYLGVFSGKVTQRLLILTFRDFLTLSCLLWVGNQLGIYNVAKSWRAAFISGSELNFRVWTASIKIQQAYNLRVVFQYNPRSSYRLQLLLRSVALFKRGVSLLLTRIYQAFVLRDQVFHAGELLAGSAVLETGGDGKSDSTNHHKETAYAHNPIGYGGLSPSLKIFHVVVAILLLVGAFLCACYFVLALYFSDSPPRRFFLEVGLSLVSVVGLLVLFFWMLGLLAIEGAEKANLGKRAGRILSDFLCRKDFMCKPQINGYLITTCIPSNHQWLFSLFLGNIR